MDILKFIEALPDSVKNLVISALLNSSMAMKNTEEEIRSVDDIASHIQIGRSNQQQQKQFRRQSPQDILRQMKRGEMNEQYNDYYYEVLKRADDLVLNSTPDEMRLLAEKYGMGGQGTARYDHLAKKQKVVHGDRSLQQIKQNEMQKRVSTDDNFPIEIMVSNKKNIVNVLEHAMGAKPIYKYSINVQRMFSTQYNIENVTEYLHIKELPTGGRLFEFYVPKFVNLKSLSSNIVNELINFTGLSFADAYGNVSAYRVEQFYKFSENGTYDVVKFRGFKIETVGFIR